MISVGMKALVAMELAGDNYISLCVHLDGDPKSLGRALKKYFTKEEDVNSLILERSVSAVTGPNKKLSLESEGTFKPVGKGFVFVRPEFGDGTQLVGHPGTYGGFSSLEELLATGVHYVYVFNNGKWKAYEG